MPTTVLPNSSQANLLFLNNLLAAHPGVSPFTLINDSIEQPARPVIRRIIQNAARSKSPCNIFSMCYEFPPSYLIGLQIKGNLRIIEGDRQNPQGVLQDIQNALSQYMRDTAGKAQRFVIIIDTLHPLLSLGPSFDIAHFLSSLLTVTPGTTLFAIHHVDIPLPRDQARCGPSPLDLLTYLATTIITTHALSHVVARKQARDRSLEEPTFGLNQEKDGILVDLKNPSYGTGMVLEVEHRRRSGRTGGGGWFYLPPLRSKRKALDGERICLLRDHPLFSRTATSLKDADGESEEKSTFDLVLTEKQREDREGVVLPYFDAQQGKGGAGEGGRILYDMGVEDDFDEEEDEI